MDLEIGWSPLALVLRGERHGMASDLLAHLLISVAKVQQADSEDCAHRQTILPGDLAGQIIFAEGLWRCPWKPLSTALGWQLSTHLGLACAFVRTSFVWGLTRAGILSPDRISSSQRELLGYLQGGNSLGLLTEFEEKILENLVELFADDLDRKLSGHQDSLSESARAFLASPFYSSIADLVAKQPQVRHLKVSKRVSARRQKQ